MTNDSRTQQQVSSRRPFAAKYAHKGWGWTLLIIGALSLLGKQAITGYIFDAVLLIAGVYLLRGQGVSPRQEEKNQRKAALAQSNLESAVAALKGATGGAAVVAHRNLFALISKQYKDDPNTKWNETLTSIDFDPASVESKLIGNIRTGLKVNVEVFQDWIIWSQSAYDVDATTKGEVHLDGSKQHDAKGNLRDLRTAEVQFSSANWALRVPINPDIANEARQVVSQLNRFTETLKPTAATTEDIASMVQAILTNTGQPQAERIEQLSALRFQRLLSDEEFEAAKTRVLGI